MKSTSLRIFGDQKKVHFEIYEIDEDLASHKATDTKFPYVGKKVWHGGVDRRGTAYLEVVFHSFIKLFDHAAIENSVLSVANSAQGMHTKGARQTPFDQYISIHAPKSVKIRGDDLSTDVYDDLRKLDEVSASLSDHIRGINDPEIKDHRVKLVRTSLDNIRNFIDPENDDGPVELPGEEIQNLRKRLNVVDWLKVSDQSNKWVQTILKILDALT